MADHIKISPAEGTWTVRAGGAVLGESSRALELREGSYPPVIYFPRDDIAMDFFEASDKVSYCPWKGNATHYDLHTADETVESAAWSYVEPKEGMEAIAGHLAFYPRAATVERV